MGRAVPDDDLPSNAVPADDLPDSAPVAKPSRMQTAVSDYMRAIPVAGPIGAGILTLGKHAGPLQAELAYKVGGGATDVATHLGASPEVAAGVGLAANVGTQMFPPIPVMAGRAASAIAAPAMEAGARRLIQSSIKPNQAARTAERGAASQSDRAITTMLDRNIAPTHGGLEATRNRVGALENDIQEILANSPATVDIGRVGHAASRAFHDVRLNLSAVNDTRDVQRALDDFLTHPALEQYAMDIPVSVANRLKQAFYRELTGRAYQPGQAVSAYDRGERSLARGLRNEVGAAEPAIAPSLAEQAELLNVLKVAGPQVAREGNKNIIGLGVLAPSMEKIAVWMLDRYPWFKSYLAQTMHTGSARIPAEIVGGGTIAAETATGRK